MMSSLPIGSLSAYCKGHSLNELMWNGAGLLHRRLGALTAYLNVVKAFEWYLLLAACVV